jgi:hypothetical protein
MSADPFACWPRAEIENSPSVRAGVFASWADELPSREAQCTLMLNEASQLTSLFGFRQSTASLALVFFHRFCSRQIWQLFGATDGQRTLLRLSCLFLAGKVDDFRVRSGSGHGPSAEFFRLKHVCQLDSVRVLSYQMSVSDIREAIKTLERQLLDTMEVRKSISPNVCFSFTHLSIFESAFSYSCVFVLRSCSIGSMCRCRTKI